MNKKALNVCFIKNFNNEFRIVANYKYKSERVVYGIINQLTLKLFVE